MTLHALLLRYGLVALFLGAGFEGEAAVVAGGVLAHEGFFPLPAAMAASAGGSFVADQLFFLLGRRFRDTKWVRRVQRKAAFARALSLLECYPRGFIFAFRFIYGIRTVSPIAIGTSRVPERLFLVVNAVAAVVWGCVITLVGYLFGDGFERVLHALKPSRHDLMVAVGVLALMLGTGLVLRWLRRRE